MVLNKRHQSTSEKKLPSSIRLHDKHALATHKLTLMRDRDCSTGRFRQLTRELGMFLTYEITRDLPLASTSLVTPHPSAEIERDVIAGKKAVVIPILRAGLVLAEGALEVMPAAHVGHIGFRRVNDGSYQVREHLVVLPNPQDRMMILFDAVIGTGNTACAAIEILKQEDVLGQNIRFGAILISPEGMQRVAYEHPDVIVHAISKEQGLDGNYITPGFGDASDRLFGIHRDGNI